jgi:hypothetical protein
MEPDSVETWSHHRSRIDDHDFSAMPFLEGANYRVELRPRSMPREPDRCREVTYNPK